MWVDGWGFGGGNSQSGSVGRKAEQDTKLDIKWRKRGWQGVRSEAFIEVGRNVWEEVERLRVDWGGKLKGNAWR